HPSFFALPPCLRYGLGSHLAIHSFPTRRSSDLIKLKLRTCQPFWEYLRNFSMSFPSENANPPDVIYFVCLIPQPPLIRFLLIESSLFLPSNPLLIFLFPVP